MTGFVRSTISALSNPRSLPVGEILTVLFVAALFGNELLFVGAAVDAIAETVVPLSSLAAGALHVVTAIIMSALFAVMLRSMLKPSTAPLIAE